ncbi:ERF family protein [Corynebacterium provencense]|uniref:ERF family protein n=1 Tax=Corynebacterium provencense TaxID=1737425 RepID=UPI00082A9698|nr:ERF family protein [Corynebacterium provencense]
MSVHETMIEVAREVTGLAKRDRNEGQRFMFRGIDAVMNAFGPAMRTHGLMALPTVEDITVTEKTSNRGAVMQLVRVKMRLTFVNAEGETDDRTVVWGEAMDSGDKATAKAHSVALRTAYLQAFCLPTDERDPDADSYEISPEQQERDRAEWSARIAAAQSVEDCRKLWAGAQQVGLTAEITARVAELKAGESGD